MEVESRYPRTRAKLSCGRLSRPVSLSFSLFIGIFRGKLAKEAECSGKRGAVGDGGSFEKRDGKRGDGFAGLAR